MKIPVYKITGQLETFFVFGKEKLIEHLQDDGLPVKLLDNKLEELENRMMVITKTLSIEKMNYEIGEIVEDNAGHTLRVVTINSNGEYIVSDDNTKAIKYHKERDLSRVFDENIAEDLGFSADLVDSMRFEEFYLNKESEKKPIAEKTEHEKLLDFFWGKK